MINQNWLFIGSHPDDIELGCGGIISKHDFKNIKKDYLILSPSKENPHNSEILSELEESFKALQISNVPIILDFPLRRIREHRYDVCQTLIEVVNRLKPSIIFSPTPSDLHQDHQVVGEEVNRLFRNRTILGYEIPNCNQFFIPNLYVKLDIEDVLSKTEAVSKYRSQVEKPYSHKESIFSLAKMRGLQSYMDYAEAFHILRAVIN